MGGVFLPTLALKPASCIFYSPAETAAVHDLDSFSRGNELWGSEGLLFSLETQCFFFLVFSFLKFAIETRSGVEESS